MTGGPSFYTQHLVWREPSLTVYNITKNQENEDVEEEHNRNVSDYFFYSFGEQNVLWSV